MSATELADTGLSQSDLASIINNASSDPMIEELILFGSRAKASHKKGSDVDLAVNCSEHGDQAAIRLSIELNENTFMPYFFDVIDMNTLTNQELIEHIERVGIRLYQR
ncbi:MAG: nucleotidyltransferase domain-containing protein [Gammaproteobacteria bacterium]|nr:nucleotidyltransferase domain-containing protein [Gammaproteobacteria bacterium]